MPASTPFRDYEESSILNTYDDTIFYHTIPVGGGLPQATPIQVDGIVENSYVEQPISDQSPYFWGNIENIQVSGVYSTLITGSFIQENYEWPTFETVWDEQARSYIIRKVSKEDEKRRKNYVAKWKEVDWNY